MHSTAETKLFVTTIMAVLVPTSATVSSIRSSQDPVHGITA
eukprot:COSAG02_NODE_5680_length_4131_cov_4.013641_1_plen_40_part_10